jgi:hypothetical protein
MRSVHALLLALTVVAAPPADAQGLLRRARDAARRGIENTVERAAEDRATQAAEGAIGAAEGAVTSGGPSDDAPGAPVDTPAGAPAAGPGAAFVNYDFVPGDHVLFADDLAEERVGDFPRRLRFVSANGEVAEWQGRRFLRVTSFGRFAIELPEVLPERFTLEFDVAAPEGWTQEIRFVDEAATLVQFSPQGGGLAGEVHVDAHLSPPLGGTTVFPVKVMVDGDYAKVYLNGTRVANVPTAGLGRSRRIEFAVAASTDDPAYFGAFRLAEGGRDLPEMMEAVAEATPTAPLVLSGVVFDTGRATLRPESGPTLDAVAASLVARPEVRVRIEGHTDDTGTAETNRALSLSRAQAVAAYLAGKGVAASRMEAAGFGPDQPVADNATPEGRQQNRRVALVRL